MELLAAVALSLVGSGGGVLLASPLLLLRRQTRLSLVPGLISYAVGTLLGVALLALVPEALETLQAPAALGALLAGILGFFMLEKLVVWRHCHTDDCDAHGYEPVRAGRDIIGYVAAGGYGPVVEKSIGLAYLPTDFLAHGTELSVELVGKERTATVVEQPLYDPENKKLLS